MSVRRTPNANAQHFCLVSDAYHIQIITIFVFGYNNPAICSLRAVIRRRIKHVLTTIQRYTSPLLYDLALYRIHISAEDLTVRRSPVELDDLAA